jgi:type IV secretion system protein VirB6
MSTNYFNFYTRLFRELDSALNGYVHGTAGSVIGAITPVAATLLAIYVMFWGWSMFRGVISEPILDGFTRIVKLSVIFAIATSIGYYSGYLSDWLWASPDAIASVIAGGDVNSNSSFLDNCWSKLYAFGDVYMHYAIANTSYGFPAPSYFICALAIWLIGLAVTGYCAFLLALSKVSLAVILAVGPIFVLSLVFDATKKFFDAWMGQVLSFVFLVMLTAGVLKLILTVLLTYLTASNGQLANPGIDLAIPALAICLVCLLVLMQVPAMASALGGGIAISTLGGMGWAYNKITGAAKTSFNVASGKSLSDMRGARRAKSFNRRFAENNPGIARQIYRKVSGSSGNSVSKS